MALDWGDPAPFLTTFVKITSCIFIFHAIITKRNPHDLGQATNEMSTNEAENWDAKENRRKENTSTCSGVKESFQERQVARYQKMASKGP